MRWVFVKTNKDSPSPATIDGLRAVDTGTPSLEVFSQHHRDYIQALESTSAKSYNSRSRRYVPRFCGSSLVMAGVSCGRLIINHMYIIGRYCPTWRQSGSVTDSRWEYCHRVERRGQLGYLGKLSSLIPSLASSCFAGRNGIVCWVWGTGNLGIIQSAVGENSLSGVQAKEIRQNRAVRLTTAARRIEWLIAKNGV